MHSIQVSLWARSRVGTVGSGPGEAQGGYEDTWHTPLSPPSSNEGSAGTVSYWVKPALQGIHSNPITFSLLPSESIENGPCTPFAGILTLCVCFIYCVCYLYIFKILLVYVTLISRPRGVLCLWGQASPRASPGQSGSRGWE